MENKNPLFILLLTTYLCLFSLYTSNLRANENTIHVAYTQASISNLRVDRTSDSEIVKKLPINTEINILERKANWVSVRLAGKESLQGWVHESIINKEPLSLEDALIQYSNLPKSNPLRLKWIERAAAIAPHNADILNELIYTLQFHKEFERAVQVSKNLSQLTGDGSIAERLSVDSTILGNKDWINSLYKPRGLAVDKTGNIYVSDSYHVIRKINPSGQVTILAGTGHPGYKDGDIKIAQFNNPTDIVLDKKSNIYVLDSSNFVIRKVTPEGIVSTLAGSPGKRGDSDGFGTEASFQYMSCMTITKDGLLLIKAGDKIRTISQEGLVKTLELKDKIPHNVSDIASDKEGNIFLTSSLGGIHKIDQTGIVSVFAGNADNKRGYKNGKSSEAKFGFLYGIIIDENNNLYVSETSRIRKISSFGIVSTYDDAFSNNNEKGKLLAPEELSSFDELIFNKNGDILVADSSGNSIRKLTDNGTWSTILEPTGVDKLATYKKLYVNEPEIKVGSSTDNTIIRTIPIGTLASFKSKNGNPPINRSINRSCRPGYSLYPSSKRFCFSSGGYIGWSLADFFSPSRPTLELMLKKYDDTPLENLLERMKWAERAIAISPHSRDAHDRKISVLTDLDDETAVTKEISRFQTYQARYSPQSKEEPLQVFSFTGKSITPLLTVVTGKIQLFDHDRRVTYGFHNKDRIYHLYKNSSFLGNAATNMRFNCEAYYCPGSVPVITFKEIDLQINDFLPIAVNKPIDSGSILNKVSMTQAEQNIIEKSLLEDIKNNYRDESYKSLIKTVKEKKYLTDVGKLDKDGKRILVGTLVIGSADDAQYNSEPYFKLLVLLEEQIDGEFISAKFKSNFFNTFRDFQSLGMYDFDEDGTDELLVYETGVEGGYSYGVLKREDGEWTLLDKKYGDSNL